MNKKIFLSIAILFFGIFLANNARAASCSFYCGNNETQVSGVYCNIACSDGMVCCEAAPVAPPAGNGGGGATGGTCPGYCQSSCDSNQSELAGPFTNCGGACCVAAVPASGNGSAANGTSAGGGWSLGSISSYGLPGGSIRAIVINLLLWILGIFGAIGILGFIISGIMYLTAAGDEDQMGKAKKAMLWSIIGVVVGLAGFVIIKAVDMALNAFSSF